MCEREREREKARARVSGPGGHNLTEDDIRLALEQQEEVVRDTLGDTKLQDQEHEGGERAHAVWGRLSDFTK